MQANLRMLFAFCCLCVAFQLLPEGNQEYQDVSRLTIKFMGNPYPFLLVLMLHSFSALHVNSWPKCNYRGESCTGSLLSGSYAAFPRQILCFPSGSSLHLFSFVIFRVTRVIHGILETTRLLCTTEVVLLSFMAVSYR